MCHSLYLNIGKCHEDLDDFDSAKSNYQAAFSFAGFLSDNGYGNMIKAEIIYNLLASGSEIFMKMEKTFFANRFAMLRDRFGTSWMLLNEN